MRYKEFLIEAKPENLGDGMIKKIGQAYFKKTRFMPNADSSDPDAVDLAVLQTGYSLANSMYNHVGPKYLIWVAKQFVQDPHFMTEDFQAWADTLEDYTRVVAARKPIERDINKFANIDQLRTELRKHQESSVGKMYDIIVPVLDEFVQSGQAAWLYKGNDYVIYRPDTWEASNAFYRVLNNKGIRTSACVTYDDGMFHHYTDEGSFVLTIAPETAYVAYINTGGWGSTPPSEFADVYNNHEYGLEYQLKQFPKLKSILLPMSEHTVDIQTLLHLNPQRLEKLHPGLIPFAKKHKVNLKGQICNEVYYEYPGLLEDYDEEYLESPKIAKEMKRLEALDERYYSTEFIALGASEQLSIFDNANILCLIPDAGFEDEPEYVMLPGEVLYSRDAAIEDYLSNIY